MRLRRVLSVLAALSLWTAQSQAQCVMCGTALASSPESKELAEGFRVGILFLMAVPYLFFGVIAFAVYRAYRRKAKLAAMISAPDQFPT